MDNKWTINRFSLSLAEYRETTFVCVCLLLPSGESDESRRRGLHKDASSMCIHKEGKQGLAAERKRSLEIQ